MVKGQKKGNLLTHCKYGHEFTEDNIIYRKRDRGRGEEISRVCKKCHAIRGKEYRSKDGFKEKNSIYLKEYRKNNKEVLKNGRLRLDHKITLQEYNDLFNSQNNKCAICGNGRKDKYLPVDHNHNTGKIRGILCIRCNTILGHIEQIGINSILEYLNNGRK